MNAKMETSPRATPTALGFHVEQVLRLRPVDDVAPPEPARCRIRVDGDPDTDRVVAQVHCRHPVGDRHTGAAHRARGPTRTGAGAPPKAGHLASTRTGRTRRRLLRRFYCIQFRLTRTGIDSQERRVLFRCRFAGAVVSIVSIRPARAVSRASASSRAMCWPTH